MWLHISVFLVLLCIVHYVLQAETVAVQQKLPATELCSFSDKVCISTFISSALNNSALDNIHLIDFSPTKEMEINMGLSNSTHLQVMLTYHILNLNYGTEVLDVNGFGANPVTDHSILLKIPLLTFKGSLHAIGEIKSTPVDIFASVNMVVVNAVLNYTFKGRVQTKKGKIYLIIDNKQSFLSLSVERVIFQKDKFKWYAYGSSFGRTLRNLNANWRVCWRTLHSNCTRMVKDYADKMISSIFAERPYKTFFRRQSSRNDY